MTRQEAERAQVILSEAFDAAGIENVGLGITKIPPPKDVKGSDTDYAIHLVIQDGANLDAIYIGTPIAFDDPIL